MLMLNVFLNFDLLLFYELKKEISIVKLVFFSKFALTT